MKKLLLPLLLLTACGYRTIDKPCRDGLLQVLGEGFNKTDLAKATVTRYKQNGAFDSAISDTPIIYADYRKDTIYLATLMPGYDYQISMPSINKNYRIASIAQIGKTQQTFRYRPSPVEHFFVCYNWVASCTVDGIMQSCLTGDNDTMTTSISIVK